MERYSTFQIKDHYYWVETPKVEAKPAPQPKTPPAKRPTRKTIRVREADGTISYYDAQTASKPVVMPGGIWV